MDYPNKSGNDNFGELVRLGWQAIVREGKAAIHRKLGGDFTSKLLNLRFCLCFPESFRES
jgi:hypothetical protein